MPIRLQCSCGRQLRLRDETAGKKVRCPDCSQFVPIGSRPKAAAPDARPDIEATLRLPHGLHVPVFFATFLGAAVIGIALSAVTRAMTGSTVEFGWGLKIFGILCAFVVAVFATKYTYPEIIFYFRVEKKRKLRAKRRWRVWSIARKGERVKLSPYKRIVIGVPRHTSYWDLAWKIVLGLIAGPLCWWLFLNGVFAVFTGGLPGLVAAATIFLALSGGIGWMVNPHVETTVALRGDDVKDLLVYGGGNEETMRQIADEMKRLTRFEITRV